MRKELRKLRQEGRISLLICPYEEESRGTRRAPPSGARWKDLVGSWDQYSEAWEDFTPSEKLPLIQEIIGLQNSRDALHVDSAYKAGCDCLLTRDTDITGWAHELQELLDLQIFHADHDWHDFLAFLDQYEES